MYRSVFALFFALVCLPSLSFAQPVPVNKTDEITNSIGMKLELIPAGEFMMGGGESAEELVKQFPQYELKEEFFKDEFPQHRVRITKPFYMSKHEVTNAQFRKFVEATNYKTQAEQEDTSRRGPGGWGFNAEKQIFEGRDPKYDWNSREAFLWNASDGEDIQERRATVTEIWTYIRDFYSQSS